MTDRIETNLEVKMAKLEEKTNYMVADISEIKQTMKEFIASADKKYASKSTEEFVNRVKGSGTLVVGVILLAILTLILNHVWPELNIRY